ncbi:acyl carrier protein [Fulvivirgaceae bacterium PWU4]|uniref:Acyl carrier protein n=1 Tax=Chryseosolibacter histidini TaxID=2782349 RepID=A0AAP2DSZ5_9BACT|nr:acyl carrier protein [Chryseosolibacter histidini]MBT1700512.1 acyl carrier protein [Chryseosolibacter histidini]
MKDKFIESFKEALEIDRPITMSDKFRDYDEWNSLGRLSLIANLDDQFDVTIEDEVFQKLITVEDLFNEVAKRAAAKN